MFISDLAGIWPLWHVVTRLGEAQVVLPLFFLAAATRAHGREGRSAALLWIALLGIAVVLTTASKVAFIGWGIGSAALDFTGISGHTMFAAAIYPPLLSMLGSGTSPRAHRLAAAVGCVLALLVGVSRFVLGAHSASEVLAGWLVGGLVSCAVLARGTPVPLQLRATMFVTGALWLTLTPATGPAVDTHSMVTRLALRLSGHERPYTRTDLLSTLFDQPGQGEGATEQTGDALEHQGRTGGGAGLRFFGKDLQESSAFSRGLQGLPCTA